MVKMSLSNSVAPHFISSAERLGRICEAALRASEGPRKGATPKRAVGSGGSMAGRKNMKV